MREMVDLVFITLQFGMMLILVLSLLICIALLARIAFEQWIHTSRLGSDFMHYLWIRKQTFRRRGERS